jgi:hypothetical protein
VTANGFFGVLRRWTNWDIPNRSFAQLTLVLIVVATFFTWRDEFREHQAEHEKLNEAQGEIKALRTEPLRTEIQDLRTKIAALSVGRWPNLDDTSKHDLLAEILKIRPHIVDFTCNDANCSDLTDDLTEVVRKAAPAGWVVGESGVWIVGVAEGIIVESKADDPDAKIVATALTRVLNWPVAVHDDPHMEADHLLIIVGVRKVRR